MWCHFGPCLGALPASQVGGLRPPTFKGTYTRQLRTIFSIFDLKKCVFQGLSFFGRGGAARAARPENHPTIIHAMDEIIHGMDEIVIEG